jgi:hypothetical protein
MSTRQILRHFKQLNDRERDRLLGALLTIDDETGARPGLKARHVKWPDVVARAKGVFGKRELPNLVLLGRQQEPC